MLVDGKKNTTSASCGGSQPSWAQARVRGMQQPNAACIRTRTVRPVQAKTLPNRSVSAQITPIHNCSDISIPPLYTFFLSVLQDRP